LLNGERLGANLSLKLFLGLLRPSGDIVLFFSHRRAALCVNIGRTRGLNKFQIQLIVGVKINFIINYFNDF
jgi:hypothetical protein